MGLYEITLEQRNFLRIVELRDVQSLLRPLGIERREHQHMRVELNHVGGEVGYPDGSEIRGPPAPVAHEIVMPAAIDLGTGLFQ
ncbi:Uncharacterised protein [Bordetella pertussis]|nr:Uncharacterised protein [Bordetella pertussis]